VVLGAAGAGLALLHWSAAILPVVVWVWVISFFRDPKRERAFAPGELCAPADGTVTEVTHLDHDETIGGPAVRVGIFLSIFNVHANRAPCAGTVRSVHHQPGRFLDARHPDSGAQNESVTMVMDTSPPVPGPVVVRQVAGAIARRIICHAQPGDVLSQGQRYGMIKFGSRTELIVPFLSGTDITVKVSDPVRAGLSVMVRQPTEPHAGAAAEASSYENHQRDRERTTA
jgi:phosphatidylserine decarboxylase